LDAWRASAKTQLEAADAMKPEANTLTRRALVEAVYSSAGKEEPIILGASSLIREADIWAPNKVRQVYANRGLAGIDGTVATAMGVAHGTGAAVRLLLGDLTLLHDAGSLALAAGDENLNLQIVVGNDHGGSIFESLEVAKTIAAKPFEQLFKTPQAVDISLLARAYGWQYLRPETLAELAQALNTEGLVIIEVNLA
jgi:2-succinyl-5-enolpyruvyl-6-hydroxy-3-cyclohexene-1-carboxylate synthase